MGGGHAAKRNSGRTRWRRRILMSLLALFLLLIAYLFWILWWAHHNLHQALLLPYDPGTSPGENILLIGSDSHDFSDLNNNGRADVIQLIHIDEGRKRAYVIHFPRDFYVSIPCGPTHCGGLAPADNKAKINASFSWGALWHQPGLRGSEGASQLLVKTLQDLLSAPGQPPFHIDHVMMMGFCGFANLTDDLGGVDIDVTQAYDEGVQPANATCANGGAYGRWTVGMHHMTGLEALGFVRERHQLALGDIDRGRDQQAWMAAVFRKLTKSGVLLNPVELPQVISDGLSNTIVDQRMGMGYLIGLGRDVAIHNLKVSYFTAPYVHNGTSFLTIPGVGQVLTYDPAGMSELGYDLRHDQMAGYSINQNQVQ
ncbi:LCP family protein [Nocardioides baekrokdamisoli]|nr:LCP family protein [Nocardioides baekrokdamisoli]